MSLKGGIRTNVAPGNCTALIRGVKAAEIQETMEALQAKTGVVFTSEEMEDLLKLPGVGRKTANVVASIIYNKPVIAVDTHVFRVSHRLGFSKGKTPLEVEKDLNKLIPLEERAIAHHWLILHGRYTCMARNPRCGECGLKMLCKYCKKMSLVDKESKGIATNIQEI